MEKIKQIFLYIDDQLSQSDRKKFEESLLQDEELLSLFNQYNSNMDQLKAIQNTEVDPLYFSNLTARFREKHQPQKKFFLLPKLAAGVAVAAILFMILINPFSRDGDFSINGVFSSEELRFYSNSFDNTLGLTTIYNLDEDELDLINSSITEELGLSESNFNRLLSPTQTEIYRMVEELSEQEIEEVYNDLSKKTIL